MEKKSLKISNLLKGKGQSCFRKNKFPEAVQYYKNAIIACPNDRKCELGTLYQLRAAAYEKLSAWSELKDDCLKSLEFNPHCSITYFLRAKYNEAVNDLTNSLNDVTIAALLELTRSSKIDMITSNYFKYIALKTAEDAMEKHIAERKSVLPSPLHFKNYFGSLAFDPIKNETPNIENPKGYLKAKAAFKTENFKDVIPACTEEISYPDSKLNYKTEALLLRGVFYIFSGNLKEGLQDLEVVIESEADASLRAYALIKRAPIRIQLQKTEAGLADFNAAEKLLSNIDLYNSRGSTYLILNKFSNAIGDFRKALKLDPNNIAAFLNQCRGEFFLAIDLKNDKLLSKAMKKIKVAIKKFPNCIDCYLLATSVLCAQKKFEEADMYFEEANKLLPKTPELYAYRGLRMLEWKNDFEKASQLIQKAIELDSKCGLAYELLAKVKYLSRNAVEAVKLYDKAISLAIFPKEITHLFTQRNIIVAEMQARKTVFAKFEQNREQREQGRCDQSQYIEQDVLTRFFCYQLLRAFTNISI